MAVGNSLTKTQPKADRVEFEVAGETIVLTPQTVRDYLVSGDKERVTMQEVVMFINLCKYAGLNPWLKKRRTASSMGTNRPRWSLAKKRL